VASDGARGNACEGANGGCSGQGLADAELGEAARVRSGGTAEQRSRWHKSKMTVEAEERREATVGDQSRR
jgi:hypothetical protein